MAWIRQLPSGLWAATVRLPTGDRVTESDRLKGRIKDWADQLENDIRVGDWIDPRAGKTTVGQCWDRWAGGRRLERASRKRDESHWRVHVAPRWSDTPVGAILRPDVSGWVVDMEGRGVGAATIEGSVGVLRAVLDLAVDGRLIRDNPARGVKVPRRDAHLDRVLAPEEDAPLLDALDRIAPERPDGRMLGELMLYCGLRWEESGALDREHVNLHRGLLHIGPVLERDGTIRPYPKTRAGIRDVPVDRHLWPRLRAHVMTLAPGGLVVTAPLGGPMDYSRWYHRVWRKALTSAGLADPQPTPHDLRHTYATRLGEQGVPAHELMRLTGHSSLAAVQRYLHAGEARFDRARDAMERARSV